MSYQANTGHHQLPVPYDRIDQNTFNQSLPQGNDVFPPVTPPPGLDQQIMTQVASLFRTRLQNSAGKTPIHVFAYNLLSQNYFQNQRYLHWMQRTMDFTAFLIRAQNKPPQEAVEKAVNYIYTGMLAMIAGEFPGIVQVLDQGVYNDLLAAGRDLEAINQDVQGFMQAPQGGPPQQAGYGQPSPQMGYGGGPQPGPTMAYGQPAGQQLPPVSASGGGFNQPQPNLGGAVAPQPYQVGQPNVGYNHPQPAGPMSTSTPARGRYADEPVVSQPTPPQPAPTAAPAPSQPQPTSTWTAGQPVSSPMANIQVPNFGNATQVPPQQPEAASMMSDQAVPRTVEEIDLLAYVDLHGSERPYDEVHIPGGVVARPAHLSGWKRTRSDAKPYAIAYDPRTYILFHVKWPDETVEALLVEYVSVKTMDYLKHEIDTRLRGEKIRPEGKVIPTHHKMIDFDADPQPVEEVKHALDEGLMDKDALRPVILDGMFTASSDLENEETALEQVAEQLGLSRDELTRIPPHEYTSAKMHPLHIPEEGQNRLKALATTESLTGLAGGLVEAVNDGVLSRRYFRFFDERLTRMVNAALADNLGLEQVNIDSFVEDIEDLFEYLNDNLGSEFVTVLNDRTKGLLRLWLSLRHEEDEEGVDESILFLADEYTNLQLPWTNEELASLNLSDEPVLLSPTTHPRIMRVVKELIRRHDKNGTLLGRHFRLITADGVYLSVIRGWLVQDAVLLKRLN